MASGRAMLHSIQQMLYFSGVTPDTNQINGISHASTVFPPYKRTLVELIFAAPLFQDVF